MFRYLVTTAPANFGAQAPKTFTPDTRLEIELDDGTVVRIFAEGGCRLHDYFFKGVIQGSTVFVGESITPDTPSFPEILASSGAERITSLLQLTRGFYGGVLVGDGVSCFSDHLATTPVYALTDGPMVISNSFSEISNYPESHPIKPSTVMTVDGSRVYWRPTRIDVGGEPARLLWETFKGAVGDYLPKRPAIFFSGGLDSALLARACDEVGLSPLLLSLGADVSTDRLTSRRMAEMLGLELVVVDITDHEVSSLLQQVKPRIPIYSTMDASIALAFYILSLKAAENGIKVAAAGQGADELFAGYYKYIRLHSLMGYHGLAGRLEDDVMGLHSIGLPRDATAAREGGVFLVLPYLAREMLCLGLSIPPELKLAYVDGVPVRKYVLRQVAHMIGLDELARVEKKALQYGTGLEKIIRRMVRC